MSSFLMKYGPFLQKAVTFTIGTFKGKGDGEWWQNSFLHKYNLRLWCFCFFETNIEIANIYMYAFARRVNLLRLYYVVWYYGLQRIWQRVQTLPDYRHAPFLRFLCFIVLFALRLFGENWFHLRDDFETIAWALLRN